MSEMRLFKTGSHCVTRTVDYMRRKRGVIPARVYFALESGPLAFRTFGGAERFYALSEESMEQAFGGEYLLTFITAVVASRFVHAPDSIHTFYVDKAIYRFLKRHGTLDCGLWDDVDHNILDAALSPEHYNFQWAYSPCKPLATLEEIVRREQTIRNGGAAMPLLFHDTDLILRRSFDNMLALRHPEDVPMGVGHIEEIGSPFYPPLSTLQFPKCIRVQNGTLTDLKQGLSYRIDLRAVNTCLMYFSDMSLAEEWANLFQNLMRDNHAPVSDWLEGEQLLLAADQRPGLMVAERRGLKLGRDVALFIPQTWTGDGFSPVPECHAPAREWHYYRPDYLPPEEFSQAANWNQTINHTWIAKLAIERHIAYGNYVGCFQLELLHSLCQKLSLDWERLEESLRSFPSLKRFFELLDTGKSIDELLEQEKRKPINERRIDDTLIKTLKKPMFPSAQVSIDE